MFRTLRLTKERVVANVANGTFDGWWSGGGGGSSSSCAGKLQTYRPTQPPLELAKAAPGTTRVAVQGAGARTNALPVVVFSAEGVVCVVAPSS